MSSILDELIGTWRHWSVIKIQQGVQRDKKSTWSCHGEILTVMWLRSQNKKNGSRYSYSTSSAYLDFVSTVNTQRRSYAHNEIYTSNSDKLRSTGWKNKLSIPSWKQRPSLLSSDHHCINRSTMSLQHERIVDLLFGTANMQSCVLYSDLLTIVCLYRHNKTPVS